MSNLKPNQKKLIAKIIELGNVTEACKIVKIDRKTYYDWLKDDIFANELKKQQDAVYNSAIVELKSLNTKAVQVLNEFLDDKDANPNIRYRVACSVIENTVKLIESKELKERIEVLEKAVEDK